MPRSGRSISAGEVSRDAVRSLARLASALALIDGRSMCRLTYPVRARHPSAAMGWRSTAAASDRRQGHARPDDGGANPFSSRRLNRTWLRHSALHAEALERSPASPHVIVAQDRRIRSRCCGEPIGLASLIHIWELTAESLSHDSHFGRRQGRNVRPVMAADKPERSRRKSGCWSSTPILMATASSDACAPRGFGST